MRSAFCNKVRACCAAKTTSCRGCKSTPFTDPSHDHVLDGSSRVNIVVKLNDDKAVGQLPVKQCRHQHSARQHKEKAAGCRPERTTMGSEYPISVLEQSLGCQGYRPLFNHGHFITIFSIVGLVVPHCSVGLPVDQKPRRLTCVQLAETAQHGRVCPEHYKSNKCQPRTDTEIKNSQH